MFSFIGVFAHGAQILGKFKYVVFPICDVRIRICSVSINIKASSVKAILSSQSFDRRAKTERARIRMRKFVCTYTTFFFSNKIAVEMLLY